MMTRAIITAFHKYTPFKGEYYEPLFDFMFNWLKEYRDEFDMVYLIDSNWGIKDDLKELLTWVKVIKVNPSLRYYDAYREVLPKIKEELVLFLDNDFVIYKKNIMDEAFALLNGEWVDEKYHPVEGPKIDVVTITDTIGEYKTDKLVYGNKFCPYFFATKKDILMKYRDIEWGPNMPEHETFGKLTEEMLNDGLSVQEMREDKSNFLFNGYKDGEKGKDLGYYHIRAGSTPAYLLATLHGGDMKTYYDYLRNQPKTEYLRQVAWFWYMCYRTRNEKIMRDLIRVLQDSRVKEEEWYKYFKDFVSYHNLPYEKNN